MRTDTLIEELKALTRQNSADVQSFVKLTDEQLNQRESNDSWSILECIAHLNRYGDFYIPELKKRIEGSKFKNSPSFKSGVLGNYFAKSMLPKDRLNKMKTFRSMNPIHSSLDRDVLHKFIDQQEQLLDLLDSAKKVDLTKTKTAISISKWIKLRLGDTFRVVIYHNLRHVVQAKNNLK